MEWELISRAIEKADRTASTKGDFIYAGALGLLLLLVVWEAEASRKLLGLEISLGLIPSGKEGGETGGSIRAFDCCPARDPLGFPFQSYSRLREQRKLPYFYRTLNGTRGVWSIPKYLSSGERNHGKHAIMKQAQYFEQTLSRSSKLPLSLPILNLPENVWYTQIDCWYSVLWISSEFIILIGQILWFCLFDILIAMPDSSTNNTEHQPVMSSWIWLRRSVNDVIVVVTCYRKRD